MLREDRVRNNIRYFIWIPTSAMLADPLTKSMISYLLLNCMVFGFWDFQNKNIDPLIGKELRLFEYDESQLANIEKIRDIKYVDEAFRLKSFVVSTGTSTYVSGAHPQRSQLACPASTSLTSSDRTVPAILPVLTSSSESRTEPAVLPALTSSSEYRSVPATARVRNSASSYYQANATKENRSWSIRDHG